MAIPVATDSAASSDTRTTPLPGARKALVLLLLINLFNYIDRYILAAVEETISKEFNVSMAKMGSLVTAFLLTYMLVSPVFGYLADRTSRWLLIGVGVILWSLASGGSGLAQTFGLLFLMRCLIGVGEAAYGPVAPTLIADLYPLAIRGKVLAWFFAAIPVGSALGYLLGGLFNAPGRWHWAFILTVPPGLLLGAWCLFMREPQRGDAVKNAPPKKATWADYRSLLHIKSYTLNVAAMTAMTFAIGGMAFFMPRYLSQDRGVDRAHASAMFGLILVVGGLLATLAGGMLGDKLRTKYPGSYFLVSAGGMLLGFPMFLAMLYTPFPLAWVFVFLAVFCLFFNTGPSNTALANVTHPSIRATAYAVNILVIHALGDAISPAIIGAIADRSSLHAGFIVVSVMMVVGGLLWLWAARYLGADTIAASGEPIRDGNVVPVEEAPM